MVFIAQLYQHPSAGCIKNARHSVERKRVFHVVAERKKWLVGKSFPISRLWYMAKVSSRPNAQWNTPKIATKTKSPLLGGGVRRKKLFIPFFSWYYAGEAEIIEKKWPQDVLYISEWIIYGRCVHSRERTTVNKRPLDDSNTAPNSFSQTSDLPTNIVALFNGTLESLNCKNHDDETDGSVKERRKHNGEHHLLQLFLFCFCLAFYLLKTTFRFLLQWKIHNSQSLLLFFCCNLQLLYFYYYFFLQWK